MNPSSSTSDNVDPVGIVTGGSSGIGAAVAARAQESGAQVVVFDVTAPDPSLDLTHVEVDVSDAATVTTAVDRVGASLGGIDWVVNAAGIFPRARLEATTDALWTRILAVNLAGPFHVCRAAVPWLESRGGGTIVNIGSLNAFGSNPDLFAYAVSKAGLLGMTTNLAGALAPARIRVNCVHPGWVISAGERRLLETEGRDGADAIAKRSERIPLGRPQTADEVAATVFHLLGPEASLITGQSICVDGGMSLRRY